MFQVHPLPIFSKKNNEKIFMNVVCCSRDWRFKGQNMLGISAVKSMDERTATRPAAMGTFL